MDITWLGHSSFKIKAKSATLVIDPFDPQIGLPWAKQSADILLMSHGHSDHHYAQGVDAGFTVDGPGEYEVKDVTITGVRVFHDPTNGSERGVNTAYSMLADGLTIVHLGDLGHELSAEQAEELTSPDVLMIPIGGHYTIDGSAAAKVVSQLEPRMVIPMHYATPELKLPAQLEGLEPFLKALGKEMPEVQPVLKVTKESLPDELKVVVLERRSG